MHRERCRFYFKLIARVAVPGACFAVSCIGAFDERSSAKPLQFGVLDVGEGLSQIAKVESLAVVFDIGPRNEFEKWKRAYAGMEAPSIAAIVLSHDHEDHYGGLALFDAGFRWTGLMVTSPYQDTAMLRRLMPQWSERLHFRIMAANDTIALLEGVVLRCLWPPLFPDNQDSNSEIMANRYSMVYKIKHGNASVLITADIDTSAQRALSLREATGLGSDIFVVPHHGSAGSMDPVFFGYVNPSVAVISYGAGNEYGHPSPPVVAWLSQMGVDVRMTAIDGACIFRSNGYYWR